MATHRTISASELYDLIWSRPMRDVAAEFGISDVGLAKTCARYGIPSPPRGYWARKQAGQDVVQQPLPRPAEAQAQSITIRSRTSRIPDVSRAEIAQIKADLLDEPCPLEAFPVTDLRKSVKRTALTLRKSRRTKDGSARAVDEGMHGVVVSSAQVERAIFVINGLVRRLEEMDLGVTPEGPATRVSLERDSFRFSLSEKTRRERHAPSAVELTADAARQKRLASRHARSDPWAGVSLTDYQKSYADWDIVHTGELVLQIEGYGPRGVRQRWADGRRQKVERMIDEIVIGMRTYLAAAKHEREDREEQERRRQHLARRHEKSRLRSEREEKRLAFLASLSDQQREVSRLNAWLHSPLAQCERPNLTRMAGWVRKRLGALQAALDASGVEDSLAEAQLFPEVDSLHDPEGEPPEWRYR